MSTTLFSAVNSGDAAAVKHLLSAGAAVHECDEAGWTPLARAVYNPEVKHGYIEVVRALVEAGANIEATISYGIRPLMLAAGYGEAEIVQYLLQSGADVTARNEGGLTALMMVKQKHYVDVINLLHEAEQDAGVGEGSCASKNAPGSNVITFLKPLAKP